MPLDCLNLVLDGTTILQGITCTWTNLIGLWFYAIMLFVLQIIIYIKTDNINSSVTVGFIVGILMLPFLPPMSWAIPFAIIVLNGAVIIYMAFKRQD